MNKYVLSVYCMLTIHSGTILWDWGGTVKNQGQNFYTKTSYIQIKDTDIKTYWLKYRGSLWWLMEKIIQGSWYRK